MEEEEERKKSNLPRLKKKNAYSELQKSGRVGKNK